MDFASRKGMQTRPLTRPPRAKRPPEVVRHVNEIMDAYRRMIETRTDAPGPESAKPAGEEKKP